MKKYILTLFLLLGANSYGSGTIVRSPEASANDYSAYAKRSAHFKPFIQSFLDAGIPSDVGVPLDGSLEKIEENLRLLHQRAWKTSDIEAVIALNIAALQKSVGLKRQNYMDRLDALFVLYPEQQQLFFEFWSDFSKTPNAAVSLRDNLSQLLKTLSTQEDKSDAQIYVDGRLVQANMLGQVKDYEHHWVFLSNVYEPLVMTGRYVDFVSKLSGLQPLAVGNCDEITKSSGLLNKPFEVFFSKHCIYSPEENQELALVEKPELKESLSEKWIWPLGFILGAGLAYQLKDKKVVIKMPAWQW